ncbi:MAG: metallophosphoesterase [Anaeromyxobacteraceae bacterium]
MRLLCFSDLHSSGVAAKRLVERAQSEGVDALVSAGDLATDEAHAADMYEALAAAGKPVMAVPGNHDGEVYATYLPIGKLTDIDGKQVELDGFTFVGWGIRWMDDSLSGPRRRGQREDPVLKLITDRVARLDPRKTVFVSHLPPWGVRVARDAQDIDRGNVQLRAWIEAFQPVAVVCGHVHLPPAAREGLAGREHGHRQRRAGGVRADPLNAPF